MLRKFLAKFPGTFLAIACVTALSVTAASEAHVPATAHRAVVADTSTTGLSQDNTIWE
jgi:hypothetical protein